MSLIDKEQFINEMNTRAEEEALDFRDIRDMVEFAPTVKAVPLDKVKQAIEKIENACEDFDGYDTQALGDYACKVGEILNKLIESEG